MNKSLNSFKIIAEGKLFDYRLAGNLNVGEVKSFFQEEYKVKKIWNGNRHILGILEKNKTELFLKLATSEGISIPTRNEYNWNDYFNKYFQNEFYIIPKNFKNGLYKRKYFYIITDYLRGALVSGIGDTNTTASRLIRHIPLIIELSILIQKMPLVDFSPFKVETDFRKRFIDKANNWFIDIPEGIRKEYKMKELLNIVEEGTPFLSAKPRHGDFTPWHMIILTNGKIGLIDGEHAQADGVESYDICYFIQRVFTVLKNPAVAQKIYTQLTQKGYSQNRLQTVLAARAIGGFLDESLKQKPDYRFAVKFMNWVIKN